MLQDFIPKILEDKSHSVKEFLRARKYQFDIYTEKEEYIKQKNIELKSKLNKLNQFETKNEIFEEKIQQYKNEQQRLNNVNVNIDELLNNSKIDANKRKYEQILIYVKEIMKHLENAQTSLEENERIDNLNEFEKIDLEISVNQLKEDIEQNLLNLNVLRNSLYKIVEFEEKKLKPLVKKWELSFNQCQKEKDENSINEYKVAVRNEYYMMKNIEQTLRNFLSEKKNPKTKLGFCKKCDGNGCDDCNNGFVDIEI